MTQVADLDEVQYDLEIDGEPVRRQLARRVWERGGWATIAITYVERDARNAQDAQHTADGAWKPAQLALLRFRKLGGAWQRQATVTVPLDELTTFLRDGVH